jgi:hypothetical protein
MQTYSLVASRNLIRAEREMLKHAEPIKVLSNFGTQKQQPKNMTDTIVFRRVLPLDYSSTTYAPVSARRTMSYEGSTRRRARSTRTCRSPPAMASCSSCRARPTDVRDDIPGDMVKLAGEHMATIEEMITTAWFAPDDHFPAPSPFAPTATRRPERAAQDGPCSGPPPSMLRLASGPNWQRRGSPAPGVHPPTSSRTRNWPASPRWSLRFVQAGA